jgi:hypothetical protein
LLAVLASGCGRSHHAASVRRVEISPWPEGPTLIASTDTSSGIALLSKVKNSIPASLPANPHQECQLGTTVTIVVGDKTYAYGPCRIPETIERLRQALIAAAETGKPIRANAPVRPVSAADWKAVFNDWYDGRMDQLHSCAAVREAMRHLPAGGMIYSTIGIDLQAYATGVCR